MNVGKLLLRNRLNNAWRVSSVGRMASLSTLPSHKIVPMPSLSPTMETGSIAKWNLNVGDRFEAGSSLCDVETDKATVSFDATDEGYIAKILVTAGDIKVGQPLLVTVDEKEDVAAFANFTLAAAAAPAPAPAAAPVAAPVVAAPVAAPAPAAASSATRGERVFASPLAKKLVRESALSLTEVAAALQGQGSGFNGRIVASDVLRVAETVKNKPAAAAVAAPVAAAAAPVAAAAEAFVGSVAALLQERQTLSKKTVPHYHVSVEINMQAALQLRDRLNAVAFKDDSAAGISMSDFVAKAAALAMQQVPDVNAAWMESFIRKYQQVDINFVMGSGANIASPVIKAVETKGLGSISKQLMAFEQQLFSAEEKDVSAFLADEKTHSLGTFTIYNLGSFGVKSAAPIVLTPQACALAIGAIVDTVVPRAKAAEGENNWEVAPIMVATLTSDHRVVDGAVAAQWLSAFKTLLEKPETMLL